MRCWVKSRNDATPVSSYHHSVGDSRDTAKVNLEEGGDDVKSSWPLYPGLHTCYNGMYRGSQYRKVEPIPKSISQFGLKSATRLHEVESLVIADQHAAVNTFPGLVHTARHTMRVDCTGSCRANLLGGRYPWYD